MRASAQQLSPTTTAGVLFPFFPVLPSPLEATSPTPDNSMIVWSLHPHFFFENSGAAWT